ncbi:MAG TPA: nucleotidyltransferase domain-containing protein [Actinophytocola sp.]|uniref:nucleotidyltransferase domain-containing protein n=1 Tax=Actinophytocola sp. TaxID=1872138 RepID=UPI002DDD4BA0|nr:nucleotidyltransferase domain-containing protein [Actinophytocola sp.]HEV2778708.1 nucleotidyltransferase domain-containing protein [Actinophytocola sp.]
MYPHHAESIRRIVEHFEALPEVDAVLLGGSIAHGFARPSSDVDIMILISDADYERRFRAGRLTFYTRDLATYPDGFVDGKYLRPTFLEQVADRGSEPARFAFADARILFSRIDDLDRAVRAAARYPVDGKTDRMRRFRAQLDAWHWYAHEALKLDNRYLLGLSVAKLVLFGGRLILTHNETLYPYHKWFLEVLRRVEDRPPDLFDTIKDLYDNPSAVSVDAFYDTVRTFQDWPALASGWGDQFLLDNELTWLTGSAPVDDL